MRHLLATLALLGFSFLLRSISRSKFHKRNSDIGDRLHSNDCRINQTNRIFNWNILYGIGTNINIPANPVPGANYTMIDLAHHFSLVRPYLDQNCDRNMDRANHNNRFNNKFYIGLYSIIVSLCAPAYASIPALVILLGLPLLLHNVTNQAVQVLQGPFAVNTFGSGISCQSPTLSIQPFAMGNNNYNWDPDTHLTGSRNLGISLDLIFPRWKSYFSFERVRVAIERQQEADKARLDFELVRLLKCGEAMKAGTFSSTVTLCWHMC